MELRDVLLTIIKILISVPAVLLYQPLITEATGLMGGHIDNGNSSLSHLNINQTTENATVSTSAFTKYKVYQMFFVNAGNKTKC